MTAEILEKEISILDEKRSSTNDYKLLLELAVRTILRLEQKNEENSKIIGALKT